MIESMLVFLGLEENPVPDVKLPHTMKDGSYIKCDPAYKYVYEVRRGSKVVYVGITGNPTARMGTYKGSTSYLRASHNNGILPSDKMVLVEYLPNANARKKERELISFYGQSNLLNKNKGG